MEKLLDAIAALTDHISPDKIQVIASRIRQSDGKKIRGSLAEAVTTPNATRLVDQLLLAWRETTLSADELALMIQAAVYVFTKATNQQSSELVWTGPSPPFVSTRRTEQALLQVINAAEQTLFITSFVAYDISTIVKALNAAIDRGVVISMLLELSQDQGGTISFDALGMMKSVVPAANLFAWIERPDQFSNGRVHAKVAVADGKICFITSANLTAYAMEKNIEAGVIIKGGDIPQKIHSLLNDLIDTKIISKL